MDAYYACIFDHTKFKELKHKFLAKAHFKYKFIKRFFCSDSNHIHMIVIT